MPSKGKKKVKIRKSKSSSKKSQFEHVEEKVNNTYIIRDLKLWERQYLRLLPWSYEHKGKDPKVKGCLNLLKPLKCEETLVRVDQNDVSSVLKIMGHQWPGWRGKSQKKKSKDKMWGTIAMDSLVDGIGKEEDQLISWWKRPFCLENVRKSLPKIPVRQPLYFETFNEEECLWGFAERLEKVVMDIPKKPKSSQAKSRSPASSNLLPKKTSKANKKKQKNKPKLTRKK